MRIKTNALLERLSGLQRQLMAAYEVGVPLSSNSKGTEREIFLQQFLRQVLPTIYRLGTGDVIDALGSRSGQLDVVIEYPFGPSFPALGEQQVRLYLAETVAAVIEVKSDLSTQWQQVERTAAALAKVERKMEVIMSQGYGDLSRVPFYVIGFKGWSDPAVLKERVDSLPGLGGALQIENLFLYGPQMGSVGGPAALGSFVFQLNRAIAAVNFAGLGYFGRYVDPT